MSYLDTVEKDRSPVVGMSPIHYGHNQSPSNAKYTQTKIYIHILMHESERARLA